MEKQKRERKATSIVSGTSSRHGSKDSRKNYVITAEQLREDVITTVINGGSHAEFSLIAGYFDPAQKQTIPSKAKRMVCEAIKEIFKSSPARFSAANKVTALKLLNKIVVLQNDDFNRVVEKTLMRRLQIYASFNSEVSANSAQHLVSRGEQIFGPKETDTVASSQFLILLLDFIEKWSTLRFRSESEFSFNSVYQYLRSRAILFPSEAQERKSQGIHSGDKPSLSNLLRGSVHQQQQQRSTYHDSGAGSSMKKNGSHFEESKEILSEIDDLKEKMHEVKEITSRTKKEGHEAVLAEVQRGITLASHCCKRLSTYEMQSRISNWPSLLTKIEKHKELLEQLAGQLPEEQKKMKSMAIFSTTNSQLPPRPSNGRHSYNSKRRQIKASIQDDEEENQDDFWASEIPEENPDGVAHKNPRNSSLHFINQEGNNIHPRGSDKIHIDFDSNPRGSVGERSQKSFPQRVAVMPQPKVEDVEKADPIINFDNQLDRDDYSELRKPQNDDLLGLMATNLKKVFNPVSQDSGSRQQASTGSKAWWSRNKFTHKKDEQDDSYSFRNPQSLVKAGDMAVLRNKVKDLEADVARLETENQNLTEQLKKRREYNLSSEFQESEIIREFEQAISTLNLEMCKLKSNHKREIQGLRDENINLEMQFERAKEDFAEKEHNYILQVDQVHEAMKVLASDTQKQIDEKNKIITEMEEYQETYRTIIAEMEEERAKHFYKVDDIKSPTQAEGAMNMLSPLDFHKLAGPTTREKQSSQKCGKFMRDSEGQKNSVKTAFSESHHPLRGRDSLSLNSRPLNPYDFGHDDKSESVRSSPQDKNHYINEDYDQLEEFAIQRVSNVVETEKGENPKCKEGNLVFTPERITYVEQQSQELINDKRKHIQAQAFYE